MKNACHLILGPHLFTIHFISGPTAAFFHPMLELLLGSGTAEISEPVPPLACGDLRRTSQAFFFQLVHLLIVRSDSSAPSSNSTSPWTKKAPITLPHKMVCLLPSPSFTVTQCISMLCFVTFMRTCGVRRGSVAGQAA